MPVTETAHRLHRLSSGVRVITAPMRERASVSVALMYGIGSRHEAPQEAGLAHFIEHMLFKGARRYPTAQAISEAIEGIGGVLNASTDKEETMYWAKVPADHFALAVDVLADMAGHATFDATELAKERQVVIEELRMSMDNPQDHVHTLFDEVMWPDHPLGRDTAGTEETVRGFERDDCVRHLRRHYHADNLVVSIAGAIDHEQALGIVQNAVESWGEGPRPPFPAATPAGEPSVRVLNRRTEQANIVIGGRSVSYLDADRFAVDMLTTVLGDGMSSRLFQELRERRALVYDVHAFGIRHRDSGALAMYLGCEPRRATDAVAAAVEQLQSLAAEEVAEAELTKAREYSKGRLLLHLESTSALCSYLGQQELLSGEILVPAELVARIDAVTAADVRRVAADLLRGGLRGAVIGPFVKPEKFLSRLAAA